MPSTYVESPRALKENFEDAMAIIKKYDKPDLFIIFTCNPKWREITENLYPGQTGNDRPDLVIRVFKLKLNNLLNNIFKHGVLGKVVTRVQVIEFQKRGLPHVNILLHFARRVLARPLRVGIETALPYPLPRQEFLENRVPFPLRRLYVAVVMCVCKVQVDVFCCFWLQIENG